MVHSKDSTVRTVVTFLLYNPPSSSDCQTLFRLASELLELNVKVQVFLMHNGVLFAQDKRAEELCKKGARIVLCSHNAYERKMKKEDYPDIEFRSQYEFSSMLEKTDKLISFL